MAVERRENQLELFELRPEAPPRPHRELVDRIFLQLRYDQLVLAGMAGVISVTIVFACGVERGKQLVRSERSLLARQQPAPTHHPARTDRGAPSTEAAPATEAAAEAPKGKPAPAPATTPKLKPASRLASTGEAAASKAVPSGTSRYAIQVVTYSRPQLARQELERLKARGERAFLVILDGHTRVYVGPFPSKTHAAEKLSTLKAAYRDCFVRAL